VTSDEIGEMIRVTGDGGEIRAIREMRMTQETGGAQVEVEVVAAEGTTPANHFNCCSGVFCETGDEQDE
jgi:hypothetical protein